MASLSHIRDNEQSQSTFKKPSRNQGKNVLIPDEKRSYLIDLIHTQNMKITMAAQIADIPYENAKLINKIYIKNGRFHKLKTRNKKDATSDEKLNLRDDLFQMSLR